MSRSATDRIRRYRRKLIVGRIAEQIELAKDEMVTKHAQAQQEMEDFENRVRVMLGAASVQSMLYPTYLNFARQVWKARRKFSGGTLTIEVNILLEKWVLRGADRALLDRIRYDAFAVDEPRP